jgi:hypothetical protein
VKFRNKHFIQVLKSLLISLPVVTMASATTRTVILDSAYGPVSRAVSTAPPRQATAEEIPVIDVSGIFSEDCDWRKAVAREIKKAAEHTGFFYIKNHGVGADAINEAYIHAVGYE